jgi:hypothetical protein
LARSFPVAVRTLSDAFAWQGLSLCEAAIGVIVSLLLFTLRFARRLVRRSARQPTCD